MKLMRFKYIISHVPGKELVTTLSQQELNQQDNVLYQKVTKFVNIVIDSLPASDGYLKELKVTKQ